MAERRKAVAGVLGLLSRAKPQRPFSAAEAYTAYAGTRPPPPRGHRRLERASEGWGKARETGRGVGQEEGNEVLGSPTRRKPLPFLTPPYLSLPSGAKHV